MLKISVEMYKCRNGKRSNAISNAEKENKDRKPRKSKNKLWRSSQLITSDGVGFMFIFCSWEWMMTYLGAARKVMDGMLLKWESEEV